MEKQYIFIGAHAEQLGSGVMKGKGERFGSDVFSPDDNETDAGLLADGKIIEVPAQTPVPDPTDGAVELAAEYGLMLDDIKGTGKGSRVTKEDVEKKISDDNVQKVQNGGDS